MFIGHLALGFAAKKAAHRVPLVVLFAACQLADLLWPVFLVLGIERVAMMRHGVDDIRLFYGNDLRFLEQFNN